MAAGAEEGDSIKAEYGINGLISGAVWQSGKIFRGQGLAFCASFVCAAGCGFALPVWVVYCRRIAGRLQYNIALIAVFLPGIFCFAIKGR
ncbi:hypothetical protein DPQ22_00460 [Candidatus Tokpelaia sp.]|nr:hypothetical protein DPQ22_00460 [Candidatus Tokpelaia sp.]